MSYLKRLVGRQIRALRQIRNLTQAQLAEMISVEPSAVTRWEASQRMPEPERIEAMAKAFGLPPTYFFNDSAEIKPLKPTPHEALEIIRQALENRANPGSNIGGERDRLIQILSSLEDSKLGPASRFLDGLAGNPTQPTQKPTKQARKLGR